MSTTPSQAAPAAAPMAQTSGTTKRDDRVETRIKSLHAQLKITADEEPQWSAVADAMRDNAHAIDQLASERTTKRSSMTAIDNLKSYEEITDAHADGLKKLVPAFESLYDKMSDTQKKTADAVFNNQRQKRAKKTTTSHG
jgi:hypothetical protein